MTNASFSLALALLAAIGQLVNVYLHLRIANAILTVEAKILDQVRDEFVSKDVCEARMSALERRPRHA